jgi:hypothetical protein
MSTLDEIIKEKQRLVTIPNRKMPTKSTDGVVPCFG